MPSRIAVGVKKQPCELKSVHRVTMTAPSGKSVSPWKLYSQRFLVRSQIDRRGLTLANSPGPQRRTPQHACTEIEDFLHISPASSSRIGSVVRLLPIRHRVLEAVQEREISALEDLTGHPLFSIFAE